MAIKIWLGTLDQVANTAGNWSGGSVPIDEDTIVFNGQANRAMDGDATNFTAKDLTIWVAREFPYDIGSSATPFKVKSINDLVVMGSSKNIYLNSVGASQHITGVHMDSDSTSDTALVLATETGAVIDRINIVRGSCQISGSSDIANAMINVSSPGGPAAANTTKLTIGSAVTNGSSATITANGGLVYSNASIGTWVQNGGTGYLQGSAAISTRLTINGQGIVKWNSNGNIAALEGRGGMLDASETVLFSGTFTKRSLSLARMYKGFTLDISNTGMAVDITNAVIEGTDVTIRWAPGTKLTIA